MNVLIDTNVIINREDYKVINEDVQELSKLISNLKIKLIVHPMSIKDIENDKNAERKGIILSKLKSYPLLNDFPEPSGDDDFKEVVGAPKSNNDVIDNYILYALYKNAVNFLITEDKGIIKKAKKLKLDERVFTISEFNQYLDKYFITKDDISKPIPIKKRKMCNINIDDPFFDSLKKDYPDFEDWWKRKSMEGRWVYCYYDNEGNIKAILILKIEEEPLCLINETLPSKKRLKVATLKADCPGNKIGELFINMAIECAVKNNIDEIYLTHYVKENDLLVSLIEEYGFEYVSKKKDNDEPVFIKKLIPGSGDYKADIVDYLMFSKKYYPSYYDGEEVNKYVVPIQPQYYDRLFRLDKKAMSQPTLLEHIGEFIVEGNTIKKAYLCNSNIKGVKQGDILLFYRSRKNMAITAIGVVDRVEYNQTDPETIMKIVGKRTVYCYNEIKNLTNKPVMVILFNLHFYLKTPISINILKKHNILKTAPMSIWSISHKKYLEIKKLGGIDERYTFDKAKICGEDKGGRQKI